MKTRATKKEFHEPVLVEVVSRFLRPSPSKRFIDATLGSGGHSLELVKAGGQILGIDQDARMLELAESRLEKICPKKDCFKLVKANFRRIDEIAKEEGFSLVDGILFDLGVSNIHLTNIIGGFSFGSPETVLDMRLDAESQSVKAADLLNVLRKDQLRAMFEAVMEPGAAVWLTRRVVQRRERFPFKTVGDLLEVTKELRSKPGLNPATLPMLALRIAVGSELENLKEALPKAFDVLGSRGKLVVISFHSAEDRIVKDYFKDLELGKDGKILTKDAVVASEDETRANPRSRSAKLRVFEKHE